MWMAAVPIGVVACRAGDEAINDVVAITLLVLRRRKCAWRQARAWRRSRGASPGQPIQAVITELLRIRRARDTRLHAGVVAGGVVGSIAEAHRGDLASSPCQPAIS